MAKKINNQECIKAIKTTQWLDEWNDVRWQPEEHRSKPSPHFYLFSISASKLRKLSGVYRRTTSRSRGSDDLGIQRRHEVKRSENIEKFVKYGFPWSEMSQARRESGEFKDLRNPGWLPTAIVINILSKNDKRRDKKVSSKDLITIEDSQDSISTLNLPDGFNLKNWSSGGLPPIEVIDGQHRLWAFEDSEIGDEFQLPVVAFSGLDVSWQAYLFYTINIKPKRINASLAFDLYPLLRIEEWLTKFQGPSIYREARAQELIDILWSHKSSPWNSHINMLGESGLATSMVTQAAWVRSLIASYVKKWDGAGKRIGGLFGAPVGEDNGALPWTKIEQAAFLILIGSSIQSAIAKAENSWTKPLRKIDSGKDKDPAMYGKHTLLNQDQGIRTLLNVTNDIFFSLCDELRLFEWYTDINSNIEEEEKHITKAIKSLQKNTRIFKFIEKLAVELSLFDWRASSAPDLSPNQIQLKTAYRGSSGYKQLRLSVLTHLSKSKDKALSAVSNEILQKLNY